MLKPKDGYSFNSETTVTVNGESVKSSLSGEYLYVPAVKTITPTKQNTVITSAAMENVKLDYKDGETPRTTATAAAADRDKYDILYECWGKLEKTDEYTTKSVAYWYSDEDYCPSGYADLTSLIRMASMNIPYDWKPKTATFLVTAFQPMILPSTAKVCPKAHLL